MSKSLKFSDLAKVVAQKAATSASKGVVISEGSETTSGFSDGQCSYSIKNSGRGDTPGGQGEVDRLTFDQVVTKFLHVLGQGVILGSSLAVRSRDFADCALNQKAVAESAEMEMVRAQNRAIELEGALAKEMTKGKKLAEDANARDKVIARLEARISEMERSQSLTQGRIIAAFKESDDFLEAYPDLSVELEDVEMDHEFLAKEEAEAEKRAAEEGASRVFRVKRAVQTFHTLSDISFGRRDINGEIVDWRSRFLVVERQSQRTHPRSHMDGKLKCRIGRLIPFMSSKTNLGNEESEQFLPSWISDHLGRKSYIDDTNQSPSFPPVLTDSPKMDTSSLTKESNVMSQAELDNLGATYSFPPGVRLRIPEDGETILSARQGEVAFYEAAFLAGLRLPIHPTIREILIHYKICPAQLSPNAWRSVIYSLVIWRHFKRHMSCEAREELAPRISEQRKGMEEEILFCLGGRNGSSPRAWPPVIVLHESLDSWGNARLMPKRTETIFGKIEPGGYFEVSKVLGLRTFKKHFALGCTALSSSGGDNTTSSGDDGAIRRALPGIPDKTLLRWLGGKVKDSFMNLLSGKSGSSLDSGSDSILDSELPPELRSDAMSARVGAPALGEKTGGKAKAEKAMKAMTAKPPTKGVVIREKHSNPPDGAINARGRAVEAGTSSPGGDIGSESMMSDASVARRLLTGVIPASDKKRDSAELELVKAQKRAVKAENRLAELGEEGLGSKPGTEVDDLKATVAELTNKLAKAKELAIEDFKASGEFKAAVTDSAAATYFSEGFEVCKRQLLHQFPNLGVDVANMAMDPSFAEEEEAMKEGEDPVAGVAPDV
ncbi:hypothetical protein Acr_07g0017890 [Actinidia rufa]|uniref:Transposase (putative) gypsy type domain-containing protein n=1 Tax=Actinidia rufa TaxID=165716 RepID=A0A7J0EYY7_9ERIC|nr:hypothetical protein Acr_07g0017890 [Actinidia rufa]